MAWVQFDTNDGCRGDYTVKMNLDRISRVMFWARTEAYEARLEMIGEKEQFNLSGSHAERVWNEICAALPDHTESEAG